MATANSTRHLAGSSLSAQSDEFAGLSRRLLVAINQVALVSQHFGDLVGLDPDNVPAGMTLQAASRDLDQLYNDLDAWHVRHEHFPEPGNLSPSSIAPDEAWDPYREALTRYREVGGACGVASQKASETSVVDGAERTPLALPDQTADRIRAFLASMRPLRGAEHVANLDEYQLGRGTIERMANASEGDDDPDIVVTPSQAADVLMFLTWVQPFEPTNWWDDPKDAPSHVCGFGFVLRTLANSLRKEERS